jgi:hypothetical protein
MQQKLNMILEWLLEKQVISMCPRPDRILWWEICQQLHKYIQCCGNSYYLKLKMLLKMKPYSVVLVKWVIFMKHTFQHLLNFIHKDCNMIPVSSWWETSYKMPCIWKTGFPCRYCTYQV